MFSRSIAAAAMTASLVVATPALAQVVTGSVESVAAALRANRLPVEIKQNEDGTSYISSTIEDVKFGVFFYDCKDKKDCTAIQFYTGFTDYKGIDDATMNAWNKEYRWGRTYIDKDGDPVAEMDVELGGGIPRAVFDANLEHWRDVVTVFVSHLNRNESK